MQILSLLHFCAITQGTSVMALLKIKCLTENSLKLFDLQNILEVF